MKRGETRDNHKEFKVDEMGQVLRYKILVRNFAIHEILYNTGSSIESIPFEEIRVQTGEKFMINNVDELSASPMFAEMTDVPL